MTMTIAMKRVQQQTTHKKKYDEKNRKSWTERKESKLSESVRERDGVKKNRTSTNTAHNVPATASLRNDDYLSGQIFLQQKKNNWFGTEDEEWPKNETNLKWNERTLIIA